MVHLVVQLGHCNRRSGSTGTVGEQAYATAVAQEIQRRMRALGHRCELILADDAVPRSDVFVAIHGDGSVHTTARGGSVGYRNEASGIVGNQWKRHYQTFGFPGGFRPDNYTPGLHMYYGTGRAHAAGTPIAFIIEGGFLTNPEDRAFMQSPAGHAAAAQAVVNAVLDENYHHPSDTEDYESMKIKDQGGEVTVLQWHLNIIHCGMADPFGHATRNPTYVVPDGAIRIDGVFGGVTETTIKRQQKAWGYTQTGVADGAFLMRIERTLSERDIQKVLTALQKSGGVPKEVDVEELVTKALDRIADRIKES